MSTTMLVCKQCNFENEPERVYCHNCGAKLDRSLLPPEATKRTDPVMTQERVRKMVSPRRGSGLRWLRHLVVSLALSALLAAVVVIIKPPDNIPEISKDAALMAPTVTDDMDGLVAQAAPGRLTYTEDQINAFLQSTIRGKSNGSSGAVLKFERAYVHFEEGLVRITYVQSIFGLPLYATTTEGVSVQNGQVVATPGIGTFGRLPISARLMPYLGGLFGPLWKVLDRDKNLVARLGSITFHKGRVDMLNKAAAPGR